MSQTKPDQSSAALARAHPTSHPWAASEAAQAAAEALVALIAAARRRSVTIQWMPDEDGQGCRFEVIGANTGDYLAIARVDENGCVALDEEQHRDV